MVKSLGKEAYKAARAQTTQKLSPMKDAFIALAKEAAETNARTEPVPNHTNSDECQD